MIWLSTLSTLLLTVVVPLVDKAPDPEDVKPGWLGFGVFLLLAAAVVFLAFSFRKQLRKVDFEEREEPRAGDGEDRPGEDGTGDGALRRS